MENNVRPSTALQNRGNDLHCARVPNAETSNGPTPNSGAAFAPEPNTLHPAGCYGLFRL
jgi:hypothetical protein